MICIIPPDSLHLYSQTGPIGAWKICPIMGGIGYATTVITFLMNIYYIVILAWSLYFMFMSFSKQLPWAHCCNSWNTDKCSLGRMFCEVVGTNGSSLPAGGDGGLSGVEGASSKAAVGVLGVASQNASSAVVRIASDMVDPAIEFWEKKVLQISDGVDQMGSVIPELALCLFIVWVLVFFALFKGTRLRRYRISVGPSVTLSSNLMLMNSFYRFTRLGSYCLRMCLILCFPLDIFSIRDQSDRESGLFHGYVPLPRPDDPPHPRCDAARRLRRPFLLSAPAEHDQAVQRPSLGRRW